MPRLALPLSHDRLDAPLSGHFGKCKWLAVVEPGQPARFLRNEGLNGRWVAEALAAAGVTDVVAGHLGAGAWRHLADAGIRCWAAAQAAPTAAAQAEAFRAGALTPMAPPAPGEHGQGGCGCGH